MKLIPQKSLRLPLGKPEFFFSLNANTQGKSMEFESVGEIIASRMLHVIDENGHKRPVSVFIGRPEPSRDASGYECPYQIIGIGSQSTHAGHGRDSIQALHSALNLLGANLRDLNDEVGGRLFWQDGSTDLGFP